MTNKIHDTLEEAPLIHHLAELRKRLIYGFIGFFLSVIMCFVFIEPIFLFLLKPLKIALGSHIKLAFLAPHEAFFTYMNLSLYAGLIFSFPFLLLQIWGFVAPGLYVHEKKAITPFLFLTPIMFYLGCCFAFYSVLPNALSFFANFQTLDIADVQILQETRMQDYAHFVMSFILVFGISFEMPVALILAGKMGVISAETLKKFRSYAIMIIAVASAFFTPPDILSMFLLAFPLYFMYELAIVWISFFQKKK